MISVAAHETDQRDREIGQFLQQIGAPLPRNIENLATEASIRSYCRIHLQERWQGENSLILCKGLSKPYNDEDHFVELCRYLGREGMPVPQLFAVERQKGWLLLTDGGGQDLSSLLTGALKRENFSLSQKLLEGCLDLLIGLQNLTPPGIVEKRQFDFQKLSSEMDFLNSQLQKLCPILKQENWLQPEVRRFLQHICQELGQAKPFVFSHRDFHSRNIMVTSIKEPAYLLIDFQDARMGTPWYDLASLLYDPYLSLSRAVRKESFAYFLEQREQNIKKNKNGRNENGKNENEENIKRRNEKEQALFHLQALQRLLKALGTYLYQVGEKQNEKYMAAIGSDLDLCSELLEESPFPNCCHNFITALRTCFYPALQEWVENEQ